MTSQRHFVVLISSRLHRCTYLAIHQSCQWEVVEEVSEVFPYVGVAIFSKTLIVETIHLCNLPTLMIATKYGNSIRKANLCVRIACMCVCAFVWCVDSEWLSSFTIQVVNYSCTSMKYCNLMSKSLTTPGFNLLLPYPTTANNSFLAELASNCSVGKEFA